MDQWIKDGLPEDKLENIITTISTIQSPNKKEMVIGFDSSADTDDEGEADPEILSEEESDSKMPESNVPCEDVHEVSNEITLISKRDVTQTSDVEEERQENIFHTRSNVKDKVCSMVIDGETCTNEVSSIMVEIVGQPVLIHPKSYNLQLLHKSVKARVDMQVKLPLHTDEYEDHVKLQEESKPKKKKKKEEEEEGGGEKEEEQEEWERYHAMFVSCKDRRVRV